MCTRRLLYACFFVFEWRYLTAAFTRLTTFTRCNRGLSSIPSIGCASSTSLRSQNEEQQQDKSQIQWDLFKKHHAKGSWKGIWTTYDYIGDVIDETVASVNYDTLSVGQEGGDERAAPIQQTHTIVVGSKRSDCETCFDSMETTTFPVATYTQDNFLARNRCAANALVIGPSLLKSGVMSTELVLSWGDGRVRAIFQHAPVWEAGVEPGSCPPQGLKLFRTMISREALRPTPPTAETEAKDPPSFGNPIFYRPVPPFNWHKKWAGTSWTWGPSHGDRGWSIDEMEETDAWQGIPTVEKWNLRLPGGIFVQVPRVVADAEAGLCRLAWLPDDETLLRVEAGVIALQPILTEEEDMMVGFHPPSLASLRCDVTKKVGELEDPARFVKDSDTVEFAKPQNEQDVVTKVGNTPEKNEDDNGNDSGLKAIRDALQL